MPRKARTPAAKAQDAAEVATEDGKQEDSVSVVPSHGALQTRPVWRIVCGLISSMTPPAVTRFCEEM